MTTTKVYQNSVFIDSKEKKDSTLVHSISKFKWCVYGGQKFTNRLPKITKL